MDQKVRKHDHTEIYDKEKEIIHILELMEINHAQIEQTELVKNGVFRHLEKQLMNSQKKEEMLFCQKGDTNPKC